MADEEEPRELSCHWAPTLLLQACPARAVHGGGAVLLFPTLVRVQGLLEDMAFVFVCFVLGWSSCCLFVVPS